MFFPRLRRQAKFMFVVLALLIGLGFVVFGVGTGANGITDLIRGRSSSGDPLGKAQKRVSQHPKDPAAYRALATAQEQKGDVDAAIATLERYTTMVPKGNQGLPAALAELGSLYGRKAQNLSDQSYAVQYDQTAVLAASSLQPASTTKLGQALGHDPINDALYQKASTALQGLFGQKQQAQAKQLATYQRLAKVSPTDPSVQIDIAQTAEAVQNYKVEVAAFKRYLQLAPTDPNAAKIKALIKKLQAVAAQPGLPTGRSG